MCNLSRKKAFTLIEILVVIGIIALLAAILFPILSRAREKARTTNCANNEHQIALAVMQYTQDHDRRFPPVRAADPDGWTVAIKISDGSIFQCPSEGTSPKDGFSDYWFNSELMWTRWSVDHITPSLSDVRVRYPANTILLGDGDAGGTDYNLGAAYDGSTDPTITGWSCAPGYATRHSGGANYAFVDGHVKWLNPASVNTTDVAAGDNFAFRIAPPLSPPTPPTCS